MPNVVIAQTQQKQNRGRLPVPGFALCFYSTVNLYCIWSASTSSPECTSPGEHDHSGRGRVGDTDDDDLANGAPRQVAHVNHRTVAR
jgi:hypothetical protein